MILFNRHNFLLLQDGEKNVTKSKGRPSEIDAVPLSTKRLNILRKAPIKIETNNDKKVSEHLKGTFETPVVPASAKTSPSSLPVTQTHICEVTGDAGRPSASPRIGEQGNSVAVLCGEPLKTLSRREANVDPVALRAALGQTFQFVPLERVVTKSAVIKVEEMGPGEEMHVSLYEHSYSRPDLDKDEMWNRIVGLQAKVSELDRREEYTVTKIRTLENEIVLLKKDAAIFREKQKILEDYISSLVR